MPKGGKLKTQGGKQLGYGDDDVRGAPLLRLRHVPGSRVRPVASPARSCIVFLGIQVKQLKRSSNKWSCCICNEKQSVCKVYGRSGAAKDTRKLVQALNLSKREDQPSGTQDEVPGDEPATVLCGQSKWADFLDEEAECSGDGDEKEAENYVTVLPENRKRKARSSKATLESSNLSAGSLKQLGMPAFFKSDRAKDLNFKPELAAGKQDSLLPPCKGRFMDSTTTGDGSDGSRENNVAVRVQDKDKYVVKSKWNQYLEDEQEQQQDDLGGGGSSTSKVSGVYRKWLTFQQDLCLGGATEIGTELEDEVVAEDSFLL